jgi:hypothetical protein
MGFNERLEILGDEVPIRARSSSLKFLQAVYSDPDQPINRRMRAAIAALPYESPRLAVTASIAVDGFAKQLERARDKAALGPRSGD